MPRRASTGTPTNGCGTPFLYFTQGTACSEVLIDRFTGEMHVARSDLLMDIGKPINPGIDRGQITGGFIQGMGKAMARSRGGALRGYSAGGRP